MSNNDVPLVLSEMLYFIEDAIRKNPRSLQKTIGPSQLGTPCPRQLGHRLAGTETVNQRAVAWQAQVGTSVHVWLTDVFNAANGLWPDQEPRWLTDLFVDCGVIDGVPLTGHLDLYDTSTTTVIDWKIPGPTSMKSKRSHGPGEEYRIQLHTYAAGVIRLGMPVTEVGLLALPAAGKLEDYWYWTEPFDPELARQAVIRADSIAYALRVLGAEQVLTELKTAPNFCAYCDFFDPHSAVSGQSCPGDESLRNQAPSAPALVFVP